MHAVKKALRRLSWLAVSLSGIVACGGMPENFLAEELERLRYIPYPTPLTYAGSGTIVGGSPEAMDIVASPESCFKRESEGLDTGLVKVDPTALPVRSRRFSVEGDAAVNLIDVVNNGNPLFGGGVNFKRVYAVKLEFTDPKVEYIDQVNLARHYQDGMSQVCKDVLDRRGFITQALHVEEMVFEFADNKGVAIRLSNLNINDIVGISPSVSWRIENHFKLVIDSPKYIGYRLGRLKKSDDGMVFKTASQVDDEGEYVWEDSTLFPQSMLLFSN